MDFNDFMKHWGRIGVTWGHFGVTLRSLGGTWEALGAHWELVGTSLGVFWGLKVLFGGLWRDLGRALGSKNRKHSYFDKKTNATRVRGGCKEGVSMGRKESGSRQVPLEDIKKKI